MNLKEALFELEALGNEEMYAQNAKSGARDKQFGVKLGDIREVAKRIKTNHDLALELWGSDIVEARLLATLIIKPMLLSQEELGQMVKSATFIPVADWLNAYVVKKYPQKEALRQQWMKSTDPMTARAGWNLTALRIAKSPDGLDVKALLDRIESDMSNADSEVQWTMNNTLAEIGIHVPEQRERALSIGERLGVYRDFPVSKGGVSLTTHQTPKGSNQSLPLTLSIKTEKTVTAYSKGA